LKRCAAAQQALVPHRVLLPRVDRHAAHQQADARTARVEPDEVRRDHYQRPVGSCQQMLAALDLHVALDDRLVGMPEHRMVEDAAQQVAERGPPDAPALGLGHLREAGSQVGQRDATSRTEQQPRDIGQQPRQRRAPALRPATHAADQPHTNVGRPRDDRTALLLRLAGFAHRGTAVRAHRNLRAARSGMSASERPCALIGTSALRAPV
jgi:hypothetical protein